MKQIYEQTKTVKQILPKQKIDENSEYRKSFYITECPVDKGSLFFNTFTYELIFLTEKEITLLNNPDLTIPTVRYLIEAYFLVPKNFDEKKLARQVTDTRIQISNIYTPVPYSFFVILTTTGCNARCFYCFEQGAKVSNMTEKTALDVADFIKKKGAKKIKIQWFGGEPLCNTRPIDIISEDLHNSGIEFSSTMVSNAYLLDEDAIKKAVELWKLKKIQVTLDGTEEVYNRIKNYVYKTDSSPFFKVLGNIENALKAGIEISIRLNMDEHNSDDLYDLAHMLVDSFNKYPNCSIYVVRLFEDTCSKIKNRAVNDRHKLIEKSIEIQRFINENMHKSVINNIGKSFTKPNNCMACSDNSVMIVPDGHLGKCEHFIDSEFIGSVYDDNIDLKKLANFKERASVSEKCDDCEFRAQCIHLKCCTGVPHHCDELDKTAVVERLHSKIRNIYNAFMQNESN